MTSTWLATLWAVKLWKVFANGAVLVDPAIGEAGDIDTAIITLKFTNGALGVIVVAAVPSMDMINVLRFLGIKALHKWITTGQQLLRFQQMIM